MNAGGESRTRTSLKLPHVSHKGEGGDKREGAETGLDRERAREFGTQEERKEGRKAGR
jgi:hypothetical protein